MSALSLAALAVPACAAALTESGLIAAADRLTANYSSDAAAPKSEDAAQVSPMLIDPNAWANGEVDDLLGSVVHQADPADAFQPRVHAFDPSSVVFLVYQADLDAFSANFPLLSERISEVRRRFSFGPDLPLTAYGIGFAHSKKRPIGAASGGSFNVEQIYQPISLVLVGAALFAPGLLAIAIVRRRRHG